MRRAALLLVPMFLLACDREPVAPDISPSFAAEKALLTGSNTENYSQYISAIGEVGQWSGPFSFAYETVTTPSGNQMWRLVEYNYLEGYQMTGQTSGDVWTLINPRIGNAQSRPIGTVHFVGDNVVQSLTWIEGYENQDGEHLYCQASTQYVSINGEFRFYKADFDHCRLK